MVKNMKKNDKQKLEDEIEQLKRKNMILSNFNKVLKKKVLIYKDTIERDQKYIDKLEERVKEYESKYRECN